LAQKSEGVTENDVNDENEDDEFMQSEMDGKEHDFH